MSTLTKDELGFVRGRKYGRVPRRELEKLLERRKDEVVYVSEVSGGVRTAKELGLQEMINVKPGDTFSVGPRITKASLVGADRIRKEAQALVRAGYGGVNPPEPTEWGWKVRLKGLVLPRGIRTDAMILLPKNYPLASPIGFYVRSGANIGSLDKSHLFANRSYHGAQDLSKDGWQWFCGVVEHWEPGRHNLVTYVTMMLLMFNEVLGR